MLSAGVNMFDIDAKIISILTCGAGTFLLRLISFWKQPHSDANPTGFMSRLYAGTGSAAVAALLAAVLWPMIPLSGEVQRLVPVLGGLFATWGGQRVFGGSALPALFGATTYGCLIALM